MSFGNPEKQPVINSEKSAQEYTYKEIENLEPLALNVVRQLKEAIEKNEYDLIIGDDRSGRLPALILGKIINKYHSDNKSIKTIFIAGGNSGSWSEEKQDRIVEHIKGVAANLKKALFVTESIGLGGGTISFIESLEKANLDFGIVCFEPGFDADYYNALDEFSRHKFVIGRQKSKSEDYVTHRIIGSFTGVHKVEKNILVERNNEDDSLEWDPEKIAGARKDIDLMAEKIYKQVWESK